MQLSLLICAFIVAANSNAKSNAAIKVLVLKLDESGFVSDGYSTISSENLADYIRERLFMNFKGTGKMYDKIQLLILSEKVSTEVRDILIKEIAKGQKAALTEICLHKYKKVYDNLSSKQKEKIQKYFPVLFQAEFVTMAISNE
jgi:hypothetical protein